MFTDENNTKLLTVTVACPVDVEITDVNGNVIMKILDGLEGEYVSENVDCSVVHDLVSDDYIKIIRFNKENDYRLKCYGNDLGQVDINLMEITDAGNFQMKYIDDISVDDVSSVEFSTASNDGQVVVSNSSGDTTYNLLQGDDVFVSLQEISLEKKSIEIRKGEKYKLNKIVTPTNASDKMFYWTSDNKSCVAVNSDGVVLGVEVGNATITISSLDGKITDVCEVIVKEDSSATGGNTGGGGSYIPPSGADSRNNSGSNSVESDIENKQDEKNDSDKADDSNQRIPNEQEIPKCTIVIPSKKLAVGAKVKLSIATAENTVDNTNVRWSSSNSKYATVSKRGVVCCKTKGIGKSVTITAKSADGTKELASVTFKIMKNAVTTVQIKKAPKTMGIGESVKLKAIVTATGKSANTTLKWTSSNTKYATVNKNGKVIAKKAGKGKYVVITAASTDGSNKKASVRIKIK